MIFLCIYLWLCTTFVSLVAIHTVRPVHAGDVVRAAFFPVLFPVHLIHFMTRFRG